MNSGLRNCQKQFLCSIRTRYMILRGLILQLKQLPQFLNDMELNRGRACMITAPLLATLVTEAHGATLSTERRCLGFRGRQGTGRIHAPAVGRLCWRRRRRTGRWRRQRQRSSGLRLGHKRQLRPFVLPTPRLITHLLLQFSQHTSSIEVVWPLNKNDRTNVFSETIYES